MTPQEQRGLVKREEFAATQVESSAEIQVAGITARERARVEAMSIIAERHPRNWDTVRVRLLSHCDRPGFAEIARYCKPVGKKKVNGKWEDSFAEGLSARFAETARQEIGNMCAETSVVYEDDLIRIVRASVLDLQRNNLDSREITVAKAVEKRGKKNAKGEWEPPEGREVIGHPRINSYGDPVWLVKATNDEIRNAQNSEISKAQRDESLRLIPKDIRDDCEARVLETLNDPKKVDPTAARKRIIDAFASINVTPDDLELYIGTRLDKISPAQLNNLRGLFSAIKDGEISFADAFESAQGKKPSGSQAAADSVADQKIRDLEEQARKGQAGSNPASVESQRDAAGSSTGGLKVPPDSSKSPQAPSQQEAASTAAPPDAQTATAVPAEERQADVRIPIYTIENPPPDPEETNLPNGSRCNFMGKPLVVTEEAGEPKKWSPDTTAQSQPKQEPPKDAKPDAPKIQFGKKPGNGK
jgi:hypothetical protein